MSEGPSQRLLRRIKIKYRIPIIVALGITSCGYTVLLAVDHAERQYIQLEKQNTKNIVETARNLVAHYHSLAQQQLLSEPEAKKQALDALKEMGLSERSYVYLYHDLNFMLMHPSLPEQSLPDFTPQDRERSKAIGDQQLEQHRLRYGLDERRRTPMEILFKHNPTTKAGFFDYVYFIDEDGLGFIAEVDDPHIPADAPQKIGYGSYFEPWGWTVLGGVYLGDLEQAVNQSRNQLLPILLAGILLLTLASWIISRTITMPIANGMLRLNALLAAKKFDGPADLSGDEIQQLSRAFDALIGQLEARDASLRSQSRQLTEANQELIEHKRSLEKIVEERTREYRKAKESAEEANRAKSRFLATMSHELRTPMSGVLGIVELLNETDLNGVQRDYIDIISTSGKQLLDLVADILNYEKLAANKLELENIPFDLHALCSETAAPFKLREREKTDLQVQCQVDDSCPRFVIGDPMRIRQILDNFLSNAFKFTEQGLIELAATAEERDGQTFVLFAVRDTGIGISADRQRALFEDFHQADNSTSRKYGGTGLGLSISKRLAELMGGTVAVESAKGRGSIFSAELPLPPTLNAAASRGCTSVATEINPEIAGLRVLVAEDNSVNQLVIKGYLNRLGIQPALVENGAEVLRYIERSPVDIILMDIDMPVKNGLETTREIRAQESRHSRERLTIVALTADAVDAAAERYRDAGMDGALSKPVQLDRLAAMLDRAVRPYSADCEAVL